MSTATNYLQQYGTILACMLLYLLGTFAVGWWFRREASRGVKDYYLANRRIPGWVVSLAFFSTFISTNTYIGQAGESFRYGLSWAWVGLIWVVFCVLSWIVLGPRMRNQSARLQSVTVPDYFHLRYQSKLSKGIRILSSAIILFATLWFMVGIAKGCAHLLETVLDIPYAYGAFFILFFTAAYTIAGGMYAVMWTDAVQGILMFFVAILMALVPVWYAGGWEPLMERIAFVEHPTKSGDPIGDGLVTFGQLTPFFYILGIGLSIGMKQISDPKLLIRFYSVRDQAGMKFAMIWTPIFLAISLVCVMGLGALVHGMATQEEAAYLVQHTDEVVGFMLRKFDSVWVSAICMMGLFAAGMSSLASVILIAGTSIVRDLWQVWQPMSDRQVVRRTRYGMLLYCMLVFVFTLYPPAGIVELSAFAGSVFAASFFPTIFGGLYFRWGTDAGAVASMAAGILINLVWRFSIRFSVAGMDQIHEVFPAFLGSLLVYIVASLMTPQRRPTEEHLEMVFNGKR